MLLFENSFATAIGPIVACAACAPEGARITHMLPGLEAGNRQSHYLACPIARTLAMRFCPALATAGEPAAHECLLRQLAIRGTRANQAAVYVDAVCWAYNELRHGARASALSLLELRRRHAAMREAVKGPLLG